MLVGGIGHLAKLVLLGELARQGTKVFNESLGGVYNSLARSDLAIGLNTELELGSEGVRNLRVKC